MATKRNLVEQLKGMLTGVHVITDIEDRFVYSFEKIFKEPAYPVPDIVIKVSSQEEEDEVLKLARKEEFNLIKRGEQFSASLAGSSKPLILLDNLKIPALENSEKGTGKNRIINETDQLPRIRFGTHKNRALVVKTFFSKKTINKCHQCNVCSDYCTVTSYFDGIETWSSKGRALLIRGLINGDLNISNKTIDILYTCTKCGLCFNGCFQDLDLQEAILATRNHIVEKNLTPHVFKVTAKNIHEHGDPSGNQVNRRLSWLKKVSNPILPEKADVLYWVGCTVASRNPGTAKAFFNVLTHASVDFTTLNENEGCCGYVLHSSGQWKEAKKVAREVIERVARIGAKKLVTTCSGCYLTFTKLYPELLGVSTPFETLHASQFIEKMIKDGEIEFKPFDTSVTYHDPCSLGRHSKIYQAPRNVLKAIPKLEFVEMSLNRELSRCCGGGGGLWSFNHDLSMDRARVKLKEDMLAVKADMLVTACPQCQMNFRLASRKNSKPVKTRDIVEIVESAMNSN
jgi:Fe-S oxidoreductase